MSDDVLHTRDALLGGRLVLWQPARGRGYRFNLDPVLLAGFVGTAEHALDLGAGVGIIGLLLLAQGKVRRVTAVEVQAELASLALRNGQENALATALRVVTGDLRELALPTVDLVVFNPPYFRGGKSGRAAGDVGRDAGRHERHGTLADFVAAAARACRPGGRIAAIVPLDREAELAHLLAAQGRARLRRRRVCAHAGRSARRVLLEAESGGAALHAEPDLILHRGMGRDFTPEVESWLR